MCTAIVSSRGTFLVDGSARGEAFYLAIRGDFYLAIRGDLEVATREDFFMATDRKKALPAPQPVQVQLASYVERPGPAGEHHQQFSMPGAIVATKALTQPPTITAADTVDEIVRRSHRQTNFPIRHEFLQRRVDGLPVPGPLSKLVTAGDARGLQLYLLLLTLASGDPYDAKLPAVVWARALDIPIPESDTAKSNISKAWLRLERHGLIKREREARLAKVTLLREDGLGGDYESPERQYFRVPLALWTSGPDADARWYQVLSLPELTILLIGRSLGDDFRLPVEQGPAWYGISADTVSRGLLGLKSHGLIHSDPRFKPAPLSPLGYTAEQRYTLAVPFKVGRMSGAATRKASAKKVPKVVKAPKRSTKT